MRINKYLALCGLGSRRKCEEFVTNGEINVNGKIVTNLATEINPKKDKVYHNDNLLTPPTNYVYYKLNKPKGYISATEDNSQNTVLDLVPEKYKNRNLWQ